MKKLVWFMAAAVLLTGCTDGSSRTDESTVPESAPPVTSTQESEDKQTSSRTESSSSESASNPSDAPANSQNSADEHSSFCDEQDPEVPDEAPTESEIANIDMNEWA